MTTPQRNVSRREFLIRSRQTALGVGAGVCLAPSGAASSTRAQEKIGLALVGAGGRGGMLALDFLGRGDCAVRYVCDVDARKSESRARAIADKQGSEPQVAGDFRRALDDRSVDAVIVATPDHWHALATVWACRAGKDVYVEKPLCHNPWEGQQMIAAAAKNRRVVQVGFQNRSSQCMVEARRYLAEGKLGRINFCRIYNQKGWPNFPPQPDADPPAGFDWDMFNGPAPAAAYNPNYVRQWHHFWRYSSGDIINDGIHQIDLARWLLQLEHPERCYSTGRRFEPGAAETPDVQVAVWQFPSMIVSFELTLYTPYMLKIAPNIRDSLTEFPYWPQCATRIEIYGTEGVMYVGRHGGGWQVFGRPKREQPVVLAQGNGGFPDPEHKQNFIDCIRSRQTPHASLREGHLSTLWAHYATMSQRLEGTPLRIDPKTEQVDSSEAMKFFRREYRQPWVLEAEAGEKPA